LLTDEVCDRLRLIELGENSAVLMEAQSIVDSLLQLMREKLSVPEIQRMACTALFCVSEVNMPRIPIPFVSGVVLKSVLATLDLYQDNPTVVGCVCNCTIIGTISDQSAAYGAHRTIELVMQSMHRFPGDFGVQIGGCGTLWNLCAYNIPENKNAVVKVGGIQLLAKTGERLWDTHTEVDT
jgi:hypothetical protein